MVGEYKWLSIPLFTDQWLMRSRIYFLKSGELEEGYQEN